MGRYKNILAFALVLCLAIIPFGAVANDRPPGSWQQSVPLPTAEYEPWHAPRDLPTRQMGLNIQGSVPLVLPEIGVFYNDINIHIGATVDSLLHGARSMRARSITFDFETFRTSCTVSVLLRASVSSLISHTLVRSINFCPHTGVLVTAAEVTDFDIIPLAERILREHMRRSPEFFYRTQSIDMANQTFFKTDDGITFLFDEFQLSSMVSGVFPLELSYSRIQMATISVEQLLPNDHAYNLMMVPLRTVAQQLGYHVEWVYGRVEVSLYTEDYRQLLIGVYPNVNEYHVQGHVRSLEAAPYNRNGYIYVPITFFEQIMPLSVYSLDAFGNITFLAYLG